MGGARNELRCSSLGHTPWLEALHSKETAFTHSTSNLPLSTYNMTAMVLVTKATDKNKFMFNLSHRHGEFGAWKEKNVPPPQNCGRD